MYPAQESQLVSRLLADTNWAERTLAIQDLLQTDPLLAPLFMAVEKYEVAHGLGNIATTCPSDSLIRSLAAYAVSPTRERWARSGCYNPRCVGSVRV